LHSERAITIVQPWRARTLLQAVVASAGAPLLLTLLTTGLWDVLLVGLALGTGAAGAQLLRVRRWLDQLPLEIAPVAGTGLVDASRVYRFRLRLGRGRPLRNRAARVSFLPEGGQPEGGQPEVELPVAVPDGVLFGPVTVVARDPQGVCGGPGTFVVRARCESGGARWEAEARVPSAAIRPGVFGGIDVRNGKVVFSADWATLEESSPVRS
jgi:hypothetical protein